MEIPIITTEELKTAIDNKEPLTIIDVRRKEELVHGMIPTAKNIPLDELEKSLTLSEEEFQKTYNFPKPKKDDRIICHCRSGGRSERAVDFLLKNRFTNTKNYKGSILAWSEIDSNVKMY
jgi:rhodanese-related sulfurtransferase